MSSENDWHRRSVDARFVGLSAKQMKLLDAAIWE